MRNIFLFAFLTGFLALKSQNRQINFEHGDIASVLEKAKKENKLVFVDAYTTWCGPCKWMVANVFNYDSVADYFNANFVNYKLDMEKGEGPEFARKYSVQCYPSLLFIDGSGKLVHRGAGGMVPGTFINFAAKSMSPDQSFSAMMTSFQKNGMNENNILTYVNLMAGSCLDPSAEVRKYIGTVKEEDLLQRNNWLMLRDYVYDHNSREIKYFFKNYTAFEKKFGKDSVEMKVVQLGNLYFAAFAQKETYDKAAFEKMKSDFLALGWPQSKRILYDAELEFSRRFDLPHYYEMAAAEYLNYNFNHANNLNSMAWTFYKSVDDKKQLKAASRMAERACALHKSYAFLDTWASVLYKSGEYKDAEKTALTAIEVAKNENMKEEEYKETSDLLVKIKANLK